MTSLYIFRYFHVNVDTKVSIVEVNQQLVDNVTLVLCAAETDGDCGSGCAERRGW